jgi:hypothetical protein
VSLTRFNDLALSADGKPDVVGPSEQQIARTLASLKSQGPTSFAALSNADGNFVQAAGGQATCLIEKRVAVGQKIFRAYQDKRSPVFADGSILSFNGGSIALRADEWFKASEALDLFLAFAKGQSEPAMFHWREITESLR